MPGGFCLGTRVPPARLSDPVRVKASLAVQSLGEGTVGSWGCFLCVCVWRGAEPGLAQRSTRRDGRCYLVPIWWWLQMGPLSMVPSRDLSAMTGRCLCPSCSTEVCPISLDTCLLSFSFFGLSSLLTGPPGLSAQAPGPAAPGPLQGGPLGALTQGAGRSPPFLTPGPLEALLLPCPSPIWHPLSPALRLRGHSPRPTGPGSFA